MAPKSNNGSSSSSSSLCSVYSLFLSISSLCLISLSIFFLSNSSRSPIPSPSSSSLHYYQLPNNSIKVYVSDLPRSLNYGLLDQYWSLTHDTRLGSEVDNQIRSSSSHLYKNKEFPPYPESPLIKQYSAEYWITGDLMTPQELRTGSFAKRVFDVGEADVVFVPFFATASAEMQLGVGKGVFRKKVGNEDYDRQREVVDFVKGTEAWKRSGGRDHVFVLTGNAACSLFLTSLKNPFFIV